MGKVIKAKLFRKCSTWSVSLAFGFLIAPPLPLLKNNSIGLQHVIGYIALL